ncbi:hypothetical protein [Aureimonas mangrovi]|uniref:hypothetical protein n=1 Tax=Aureimonas mangrovi TaxID=2758041 RepID=UPI00163D51AC|nr:hypothetical protein [Aureimonas mangrovi]
MRKRATGAAVTALCAAVLAASAERALAGAWTLKAGEGQAIATVVSASAERRFDGSRERVEAPHFSSENADILLEYGATDVVTLRAKGAYGGWRVEDGASGEGFGVQEFGARVRVLERGPYVGSVEASLRVAEAHGDVTAGYEVRLLAGASAAVLGLPSFGDLQLGYRYGPSGLASEVVADVTLGIRPFERTMFLFQTFSTMAAETGRNGLPLHDRHRLRASVVFDVTRAISVQAGAETTLAGSNVAADSGFLGSLWFRF